MSVKKWIPLIYLEVGKLAEEVHGILAYCLVAFWCFEALKFELYLTRYDNSRTLRLSLAQTADVVQAEVTQRSILAYQESPWECFEAWSTQVLTTFKCTFL